MPGRPLDVLEDSLNEPVSVELKDGTTYRGALAGYDQHMNLVLDAISTPVEGDVAASEGETVEDTIVIRGDNVLLLKP